jgi:6-phosphogluconate dehydrogenase
MQLAMIGMGRMGMNMTRRLLLGGHEVVAFNRTPEKVEQIAAEGAVGAYSLEETVEKLASPRVIWLMLPAGRATEDNIGALAGILSPGDIIIDGGNTYYKDDIRRSQDLAEKKINYMDAGVSGGIWGLDIGYCLMAGGEKPIFETVTPVLKTLAPKEGYLYCGPAGAGHFVKMIHNGIEYGMMQAYAEGFDILDASPYGKALDYAAVSHLWNQGSVIRSWLLELAEKAFLADGKLSGIRGFVEDSGEGRWTVQQAVESGVSAPVTALSLFRRFESRKENSFSARVLSALRREFGGHEVKRKD